MKQLVAFVAALFLASCASVQSKGSSCQPIRVMTWNIAAGHGDIARIAETIRESSPDIVALQEVDVHWHERSAFVDQADSLARSLKMEYRFAPIYNFPDSSGVRPPRQFGVAILSRYPIRSWQNYEITRLSTQQANAEPSLAPGFLETMIDTPDGAVRAFSTHLDYRANPVVRTKQVIEMIDVIRQSKVPTLLFGDLNATPNAPELAPLKFLHDAAIKSPLDTYPAEHPSKRIDYVLASNELVLKEAEVPVTTASDHRPVLSAARFRSCTAK
jgi:endonuclease/exonuclease/phosphatase family metal-dependent hydrolase